MLCFVAVVVAAAWAINTLFHKRINYRKAAAGAILVYAGLFVLALALTWPGFHGYHSGYNFATDNECKTWLGQQYCRHTSEAEQRQSEQRARLEGQPEPERAEHERQQREVREKEEREGR